MYNRFNSKQFKPILANKYNDEDPTGYMMSEKLDGIRGIYFDGKFMTRTNKPISAPASFIENLKNLPKGIALDGELFTKRGKFSRTSSIVSKKIPIEKEWLAVKFVVFDIPNMIEEFEKRYSHLVEVIGTLESDKIKVSQHVKVKSRQHLDNAQNCILKHGGEGVMLRLPNSYYQNKRSHTLLKYKNWLDDEVVVKDYEFGEGKYTGMLGALTVQWLHPKDNNNFTFEVGSGFTADERKNHLTLYPKGTILKIKYFELTELNAARMPIFLSVVPKGVVH
jgi:DNA ligase-1